MDIVMPQPKFITFANRQFELVTVHPRPRGRNGAACAVHIDLGRQVVEVAGEVPAGQRMALVREAEKNYLSAGRLETSDASGS